MGGSGGGREGAATGEGAGCPTLRPAQVITASTEENPRRLATLPLIRTADPGGGGADWYVPEMGIGAEVPTLPAGTTGRAVRSFVDDEVNRAIAVEGFALLPRRLPPRIVHGLSDLYQSVIEELGTEGSGHFLPSMVIPRIDLRARLWDGVRDLIEPSVQPLFRPGTTEVLGGSFVAKPGSPRSARRPHQDPTIFDEAVHASLSLWIPLSDSGLANGTIHILPGSHRMGNHVRPPDVDSFETAVAEVALRESRPVEVQTGEILVVDGAVIHHSPPNGSGVERVAAIGAVRPAGADMHFVRSEAGDPHGTADVFRVGPEMYRSGDLLTPGLGDVPLVARVPYRPATLADLHASRALA